MDELFPLKLGDGSESESELDEWDKESDEGEGYRDPLKGGTRSTNLVVTGSQYAGSWLPRHGWRELYQNWLDGIKESNGLSKKFNIKTCHNRNIMLFVATHPDEGTDLGYIKFSRQTGTVELTNYEAWLSGKTLGIGSTSKTGKDHLVGHHGEGYKVAALVLFREGYPVKIKASGCDWTFFEAPENNRYAGDLCVRIKNITQMPKGSRTGRVGGGKGPRKGNVWGDVTFKIGGGKGTRVTDVEFQAWVNLALELDPPTDVLETANGSLILDDSFSNKIFLKGILLEEVGSASGEFKFGYNLYKGRVDRDRKRLSGVGERERLLAKIWAEAIEKNGTLLTRYVEMLRSCPPPSDVNGSEMFISTKTARKIWRHLLDEDPGRRVFYYDSRRGDKDVELIRDGLKKDPVQLPALIWTPLENANLVRTPREQQIYLFRNAPDVPENGTYSIGLGRALRASLALDARTASLEVVFKAPDSTQLDLLVLESRLEINGTWLDFRASHEEDPCWLSKGLPVEHFCCDHIVTDLHRLALEEAKRHAIRHAKLKRNKSRGSDRPLYRRVCENVRQMPLMIDANPGVQYGEVDVSWTNFGGSIIPGIAPLEPGYRITLHRETTCSSRRNDLLAPNIPDAPPSPTSCTTQNGQVTASNCGCPEQVVPQTTCKATFTELNPEEDYFPMISRNEPQAFFGLAPASVRPTSTTHLRKSLPPESPPPERQRSAHDSFSEGREVTPSNSDDEFVDVGVPHSSLSDQIPSITRKSGIGNGGESSHLKAPSPTKGPQAHDSNRFQPAEDIIARFEEDFHMALGSLRDEVSRLRESEASKAQLEAEAWAEAEANKKELAAKELELQTIQEENRSLKEDTRKELAAKELELQTIQDENRYLKEDNKKLDEEVQQVQAVLDIQARQVNEAVERLSRRKHARGSNEASTPLPPSKRQKSSTTDSPVLSSNGGPLLGHGDRTPP